MTVNDVDAWEPSTFPPAENLLAILTIAAIPRRLATRQTCLHRQHGKSMSSASDWVSIDTAILLRVIREIRDCEGVSMSTSTKVAEVSVPLRIDPRTLKELGM
ncbi:hypothetical protein ACFWYW_29430 [Nonomuraea sp. NPDC059023]|uniref:hypothetical protein n=1 Tax=unclassified Nonomuraea TaxID=2593643 RepID=UPI0036A78CE6